MKRPLRIMIGTKHVYVLALAAALCLPGFGLIARAAAPSISKIGPDTISVGDPDFTLLIRGENFNKSSVVLLDGTEIPAQFVTKQRVQALIPQSVSAAVGTHTIAVRTDGGTSTSEALTVGVKAPNVTIERTNPDAIGIITTGISAEFRVAGAGFKDDSKVLVYGRDLPATLRDKTTLSVILPPEFLAVPGLIPFQVKTSGALSNLFTVPFYDKAATVSSIDPTSVKAGSATFTLKIDGAGFSDDAVVRIGSVDIVPTDIMPQQIKVEVPASVVANEAQLPIYVVQPTGLSNVALLRVTPADGSPLIYNIAPETVQAGVGVVRIEVTGANFEDKSKVLLNGVETSTIFRSKAVISFKLTSTQTGTSGVTYQIQVRNNDGTVTNSVVLKIVSASVVSTLTGDKLDGFVDGGPDEAKFRRPSRMALGPDGLIYVADQLNHAIRRFNPATGFVETIVGDGLPGYVDTGDSANPDFDVPRFNNPLGVAVAEDGTIFVADYGNNVIRRVRTGSGGYTVDTVAGANELIDDKDVRDQTHSTRRGLPGVANGAGAVARFRGVDGMALASDGTLYVADSINQLIRAIDTQSTTFDVTSVSGLGITGFTDGGRMTARYTLPVDVALAPNERELFVADFGNNRVRRVNLATGDVTTYAGSGFEGTDSGGPLVASFQGPIGVAVGANGTVYVSDHFSDTIRSITTLGVTTTLAGTGKNKFRDGLGPLARFKDPRGILYVASLNSLFVADQGHQRVRRIAL